MLTETRQTIGRPLAFLTELHGWYVTALMFINLLDWTLTVKNRWHIFTAIGGYVAVAIVDLVTTGKVLEDPTKEFAWPIGPAARVIESLNAPKKVD
jgi:dihydroceramidase